MVTYVLLWIGGCAVVLVVGVGLRHPIGLAKVTLDHILVRITSYKTNYSKVLQFGLLLCPFCKHLLSLF